MLQNPSFEDGAGGLPTAWSFIETATAEEFANFETLLGYRSSIERFENGWDADPLVLELANAEDARFSSANGTPSYAEHFGTGWGYDSLLRELVLTESAPFGAESFDWSSHKSSFEVVGDLEAAWWERSLAETFDWFASAGTQYVAASFASGPVHVEYETFEPAAMSRDFSVDLASSKIVVVGHTFVHNMALQFTQQNGDLPSPLNTADIYYVNNIDGDMIDLLDAYGTQVIITTRGTGTHKVGPSPAKCWPMN